MRRPKPDPVREDRIHNEAIVDASPEEQALSWYYYLEGKINFPFHAQCVDPNTISPLRKGETVEVLRLATEDACEHDMLVQIRWPTEAGRSPSHNWRPSKPTKRPTRPSATGITGLRRVVFSEATNHWPTNTSSTSCQHAKQNRGLPGQMLRRNSRTSTGWD